MNKLGMHIDRKSRELGVVAAILVVVALAYALFSSPVITCVNDGSYDNVLRKLHLVALDQPATKAGTIMEEFGYLPFDYAELLQPGQPAIMYAGAAVRMVTEPIGLHFSTRILAGIYILMIAAGTYLLVSGLFRRAKSVAIIAGLSVVMLAMHSTLMGYLNSLYDMGAAVAFSFLYFGSVVHGLCMPRGCGGKYVIMSIVTGMLMLQATPYLAVMIPCVVVSVILLLVHSYSKNKMLPVQLFASGLTIFFAVQSVSTAYSNAVDWNSFDNNYNSVFSGYLLATDNPEEMLREFGLEASYAQDIGHTYYDEPKTFQHDPNLPEEEEKLQSAINLKSRLVFCFRNPGVIAIRKQQLESALSDVFSTRIVVNGKNTQYMRASAVPFFEMLLGYGTTRLNQWMLIAAGLFLILACMQGKNSMLCLSVLMSLFYCSAFIYLPWALVLTGGIDSEKIKALWHLFVWMSLFGSGIAVAGIAQRLNEIFSNEKGTIIRRDFMPETKLGWLFQPTRDLQTERLRFVGICGLICLTICGALMLPESHPGGVNNGDYGRMMEHLDISWTEEYEQNLELQAVSHVIEEYDFREPFHPLRMTPLDPSYSLVYPSFIARIWARVTNTHYSTYVIAWVLLAVTVGCILLILYDLYPMFERVSILFAVGLITMLLGENYIAWYNALFGESAVSVGLLMTITFSIHLCTLPKGASNSWKWLLALGFGIHFMCCSKAQMALALPIGCVLIIVFTAYHTVRKPWHVIKNMVIAVLLLSVVIYDTLGVYQKNDNINAKYTTWQSVFYGLLVATDEPEAAMKELNIDIAMKADIGKHAYEDPSTYVYPVDSKEAEEGFFDHVNTFTIIKYYLNHFDELIYMLDRAAQQSITLHDGWMTYKGEEYTGAGEMNRFNIWKNFRPITACSSFFGYCIIYMLAITICVIQFFRRKCSAKGKLMALLYICILGIGALQYPLTVLGNGFADNNKQLYAFMLCHDLLVLGAFMGAMTAMKRYAQQSNSEYAEGERL